MLRIARQQKPGASISENTVITILNFTGITLM